MRKTSLITLAPFLATVACTDPPLLPTGSTHELVEPRPDTSSMQWSGPHVIQGRYVVQLESGQDPREVISAHGLKPNRMFSRGVRGFTGALDAGQVRSLQADRRVRRIEPDRIGFAASMGAQSLFDSSSAAHPEAWGLDRIDSPTTLDGLYARDGDGDGVRVYVLDTGLQADHSEFEGRAIRSSHDFTPGWTPDPTVYGTPVCTTTEPQDCAGHGTHVAGIVGGATFGVAKKAKIIGYPVFEQPTTIFERGFVTYGAVIQALDSVMAEQDRHGRATAVVNLSLSFKTDGDTIILKGVPFVVRADSLAILASQVDSVIKYGALVIASGGVQEEDACNNSPAVLQDRQGAITVSAINRAGMRRIAHGPCVTMFAPGGDPVRSAFPPDREFAFSGTSQAAPHVAGVAALYLSRHPTATPAEVETALLRYAHKDVVNDPLTPSTLLVSSRFIDSIVPSPSTLSLWVSNQAQVQFTAYNELGLPARYVTLQMHSSNPGAAALAGSGWLEGIAPGTSNVTASTGGVSSTPVPVQVHGVSHAYRQVLGLGGEHACGISSAGQTHCWGANFRGQLGDGTTVSRPTAARVTPDPGIATVTGGYPFTCALTRAGEAKCWGQNYAGQLGDGSAYPGSSVPVQVNTSQRFVQISSGQAQSCAVTQAGVAWCWGYNHHGSLGVGDTLVRTSPVAVSGVIQFKQVSTGHGWHTAETGYHSCGVAADGAVFCWGRNQQGQLGDGTTQDRYTPVQVATPAGVSFVRVGAGGLHTCALATSGQVYCWGDNSEGQFGDGWAHGSSSIVPRLAAGGRLFTDLAVGGGHACGLTSQGEMYCWGDNFYGQLGINVYGGRSLTAQRSGPLLAFSKISAGSYNTCAITSAGTAYCAGFNRDGQAGTGSSGGSVWLLQQATVLSF